MQKQKETETEKKTKTMNAKYDKKRKLKSFKNVRI